MSLIFNNKKITIPGLVTVSYIDGVPHVKRVTDFNARKETIRMIVGHTHKGIKGNLLPGMGPNSTIDEALARYQVNTERAVSWDYTIDFNGEIICQNDPNLNFTWQAGNVNPRSLGFEMIQKDNGDVYEGEIEKAVFLIDVLTALLGIQRQIIWDNSRSVLKLGLGSKNCPKVGVVKRLQVDGGKDVVGIVGHRNITKDRGPGDPGDHLFWALQKAGYMCFDLDKEEDLQFWKAKQKELGFSEAECDGIALKKTVAALKVKGHKHGMLVSRPVDDLLEEV